MVQIKLLATVHHPNGQPWQAGLGLDNPSSAASSAPESKIRAQLREWEAANQAEPIPLLTDDAKLVDSLSNSLTRPQSSYKARADVSTWLEETAFSLEDDGSTASDGPNLFLQIGDLIALPSSSHRAQMLGIYLGQIDNVHMFYSATGGFTKWPSEMTFNFAVPNFISPTDLRPLLTAIAESDNITAKWNDSHVATSKLRNIGEPVVAKIAAFIAESDALHQAYLDALENPAALLSSADKTTYLTLEQIADRLLPGAPKVNGRHRPATLYAVYLTIVREEYTFCRSSWTKTLMQQKYAVRSFKDAHIIRHTEAMVHQMMELAGTRSSSHEDVYLTANNLGSFILKAREVIRMSRLRRRWHPHGMVGPELQGAPDISDAFEWNAQDIDIIRFLEMWVMREFDTSSPIQSTAARLVRFIGLYDDAESAQGFNVGFSLLTELGWYAPWEMRSRYLLRVPGTLESRDGGLAQTPLPFPGSAIEDVASAYRKDWGNLRLFCIDGIGTTVHDDAISVEATNKPGEYWIHTHVADPTSRLRHDSPIARAAQETCENCYVPWHNVNIFPDVMVEKFSVAADRPCLTFSALVNEAGDLLDYKIQPGIMRNVVYTTPDEVMKVIPKHGEYEPARDPFVLEVGTSPEGQASAASMQVSLVAAEDFSTAELEDLTTLARLAQGRSRRRIKNGKLELHRAGLDSWQPSVAVNFHGTTQSPAESAPNASTVWRGDPYIKVYWPDKEPFNYLVEEAMVLAGEVAAKWCRDRHLPIPYLTAPEAMDRAEAIQRFVEEEIRPNVQKGMHRSELPLPALQALIGVTMKSVDPAWYVHVGLDAYTRTTSPLRRYCDLLVHWQVHAALAEEHRRGASLAGSDYSAADWLPFSRQDLSDIFIDQKHREGHIKTLHRAWGPIHWLRVACHRALHFGEAELPKTFTFRVTNPENDHLESFFGTIDLFESPAFTTVEGLNGVVRAKDLRRGDRFEVTIKNLNVTSNTAIQVTVLRKLEPGEVLQPRADP